MQTKQLTEIERQERNGKFVANEIYCCQSMLVEGMLEKEVFDYGDIENLYEYRCPECDYGSIEQETFDNGKITDEHPNYKCPYCEKTLETLPDETAQEIYEWWVCSDWMIGKLRALGEPILSNDYGDWWGRCGTGQAIKLDNVIDRILEE